MGNADATRARILAAATAEFAAHGLAGARVDRIAAAAGANKAQLYAYYGSKDALFDTALTRQVESNLDRVPLTVDDLPGYAVALHDFYLADPALVRLATWARLERTPTGELLPTEGTWTDNLAAVARAQAAGVLVEDLAPADLFSMLVGLALTWAQASITRTSDATDPPAEHERRRAALAVTVARAFCRTPAAGPPEQTG